MASINADKALSLLVKCEYVGGKSCGLAHMFN